MAESIKENQENPAEMLQVYYIDIVSRFENGDYFLRLIPSDLEAAQSHVDYTKAWKQSEQEFYAAHPEYEVYRLNKVEAVHKRIEEIHNNIHNKVDNSSRPNSQCSSDLAQALKEMEAEIEERHVFSRKHLEDMSKHNQAFHKSYFEEKGELEKEILKRSLCRFAEFYRVPKDTLPEGLAAGRILTELPSVYIRLNPAEVLSSDFAGTILTILEE